MDENKYKVVPVRSAEDGDCAWVPHGPVTRPEPEEEVIVVSDGRKRVAIQNELGERIGVFLFNPTDLNILNRYNEVADQFGDVVKPLQDVSITAEGVAAEEAGIEALNEAEERMIELLDYVINGNSREAFFSKTHIFAPTNGIFYCEEVLNKIGDYISMKFDSEVKKVNARVSKHTHGYRTGKHRKGDR